MPIYFLRQQFQIYNKNLQFSIPEITNSKTNSLRKIAHRRDLL